jgi:hypothetical protein
MRLFFATVVFLFCLVGGASSQDYCPIANTIPGNAQCQVGACHQPLIFQPADCPPGVSTLYACRPHTELCCGAEITFNIRTICGIVEADLRATPLVMAVKHKRPLIVRDCAGNYRVLGSDV